MQASIFEISAKSLQILNGSSYLRLFLDEVAKLGASIDHRMKAALRALSANDPTLASKYLRDGIALHPAAVRDIVDTTTLLDEIAALTKALTNLFSDVKASGVIDDFVKDLSVLAEVYRGFLANGTNELSGALLRNGQRTSASFDSSIGFFKLVVANGEGETSQTSEA